MMGRATLHLELLSPSGRWVVKVSYPGQQERHSLVSAPTKAEAVRLAEGYAARWGWRLELPDDA